jgi:hypothetical protein
MKSYVTFGFNHRHEIGGVVFDKDCVAVVEGDRAKVFEIFGPKFCFEYEEGEIAKRLDMKYFPRGLVEVSQ